MKHSTPENLNQNDRIKLARFLKILEGVSTRKAASNLLTKELKTRGFIDTIELKTTLALSAEQVGRSCKKLGWKTSRTKLRDKRNYLKAESPFDSSVHFYFRVGIDNSIRSIITKPDSFSNVGAFIASLKQLIEPYELRYLGISRIDFTCDFEMPYYDFIKCIEVKRKQIKTDYVKGGAKLTGSYYGTGEEQILAYDKTEQAKLKNDVSRLEVKLRGKKLPIRTADELLNRTQFLSRVSANNPFCSAHMFDLEIDPLLPEKALGKEFLTLLKRQGFQAAKQQLNIDRNFERNIGVFITMKPHIKQPSDILIEGLNDFFRERPW